MPSYTIYPVATSGDEGVTYGQDGFYSTARENYVGSSNVTGASPLIGQYYDPDFSTYTCQQYAAKFDLSSVTGTFSAGSVNIKMVSNNVTQAFELRQKAWTTLASAFTAGSGLGSLTQIGTAQTRAAGVTTMLTFALSGYTAGVLGFLLHVDGQRLGNPPAGLDQATIYDSSAGGTTNDPYLSITTSTGFTLACASGSFALAGQSVDLKVGRRIDAASGGFTLTGQAVGLLADRKLSLASRSFTFTGQDAGLRADRLVSCASGAFTLTGQDAGLFAGRRLAAESGAFTMTWGHFGIVYWPIVRPTTVTWGTVTPTPDGDWTEVSPWS